MSITREPHQANRQAARQSHQAADVIVVRMRGDDQVESLDALTTKRLPELARVGPGVNHDHAAVTGSDESGVALADVEERHCWTGQA